LRDPGVVAHGVALKPGKPICLAVTDGKPVVILPGFPTSAIFTFHEFVAPVIRAYAGLPVERRRVVDATLPMRVNSERGRTEYLLVGLVQGEADFSAYPMGKGSGSVTTFSGADGFITIDQHTEILDAGSKVSVQLLGQQLEPADLVIVGSHCVGLDLLVGKLMRQGIRTKAMYVGSMGGLAAAKRGESDIAGVHLLDPATGEYNRPMLTSALSLVPGYGRMQGIVYRRGDTRFEGKRLDEAIAAALAAPDCVMVNRKCGQRHAHHHRQAAGHRAAGRLRVQTKSHNAVAAAVAQGRADWGVAIDTVARQYGLGFIAAQEERYDFVVPTSRLERPAVRFVSRAAGRCASTRRVDCAGLQIAARYPPSLAGRRGHPRSRIFPVSPLLTHLRVQPLGKSGEIDDDAFMRARPDQFGAIHCPDREFDTTPVDLDDLGLAGNAQSDRRRGEMANVDASAERALVRIEVGLHRVERSVFHHHDHDRRREHRRQGRVLEAVREVIRRDLRA
jgi:molybdate-binding protein